MASNGVTFNRPLSQILAEDAERRGATPSLVHEVANSGRQTYSPSTMSVMGANYGRPAKNFPKADRAQFRLNQYNGMVNYLTSGQTDYDTTTNHLNSANRFYNLASSDEERNYWRDMAEELTHQTWRDNNNRKKSVQDQIDDINAQITTLKNSKKAAPVAGSASGSAAIPTVSYYGLGSAGRAAVKQAKSEAPEIDDQIRELERQRGVLEEQLASFGENSTPEIDAAKARMAAGQRGYNKILMDMVRTNNDRIKEINAELKRGGLTAARQKELEDERDRLNNEIWQTTEETLYAADKELVDNFDATWNGGTRAYNNSQRVLNVVDAFGNRTAGAFANIGAYGLRALDWMAGADYSALAMNPEDVDAARAMDTYTADYGERSKTTYDENGEPTRGTGNNTVFVRGGTLLDGSPFEMNLPGAVRLEEIADNLDEENQDLLREAKAGLGWGGRFAIDAASTLLDMGFDAFTHTGLAGMATRVFGSGVGEARRAGAGIAEQGRYGITKALIEVATEKLGDGLQLVYGKGLTSELSEKVISKLAKSDAGANVLRFIIKSAEEGGEEIISDLLDPFAQWIISEEKRGQYFSQLDISEMLYDFLLGAAMGFGGQVTEAATGGYKAQNIAQTEMMRRELDQAIPLSQRELDRYNAAEERLDNRLANRYADNAIKELKRLGLYSGSENGVRSRIGKILTPKTGNRQNRLADQIAEGFEAGGYTNTPSRDEAFEIATGITPQEADNRANNESWQAANKEEPVPGGDAAPKNLDNYNMKGLNELWKKGELTSGQFAEAMVQRGFWEEKTARQFLADAKRFGADANERKRNLGDYFIATTKANVQEAGASTSETTSQEQTKPVEKAPPPTDADALPASSRKGGDANAAAKAATSQSSRAEPKVVSEIVNKVNEKINKKIDEQRAKGNTRYDADGDRDASIFYELQREYSEGNLTADEAYEAMKKYSPDMLELLGYKSGADMVQKQKDTEENIRKRDEAKAEKLNNRGPLTIGQIRDMVWKAAKEKARINNLFFWQGTGDAGWNYFCNAAQQLYAEGEITLEERDAVIRKVTGHWGDWFIGEEQAAKLPEQKDIKFSDVLFAGKPTAEPSREAPKSLRSETIATEATNTKTEANAAVGPKEKQAPAQQKPKGPQSEPENKPDNSLPAGQENGTIGEKAEGGTGNERQTISRDDGGRNSGTDGLVRADGVSAEGVSGEPQKAKNAGGQESERSSQEKISAQIRSITGKEATKAQIDALSETLLSFGVDGNSIIDKRDYPPGVRLFSMKFQKIFGTSLTVIKASPNSTKLGANLRFVPELGIVVATSAANDGIFGSATVHEGVHNVFRKLVGASNNYIATQAINNLAAPGNYGPEMATAFSRVARLCSRYAKEIVAGTDADVAALKNAKTEDEVKTAIESIFKNDQAGKEAFEAKVNEEIYNDLVAGLNSRVRLANPAEAIKYVRDHFSNVSDIKASDIEALIALGDRVGAGFSEKTVQQEGGETDAEEAVQSDYLEEAPSEPAGTQTNQTTPPAPHAPGVVDKSQSAALKREVRGETNAREANAKTIDGRMNSGDGTYISKSNADRTQMANSETDTVEKSNRQYDRLMNKEKGSWTDDDVVIAQKLMGDMLKAVRDYQLTKSSRITRKGLDNLSSRYWALALRHTEELSKAGQKLQAKYMFTVKEEILNRAAHTFLFTKDGRFAGNSPLAANAQVFAGIQDAADRIEKAVEAKDAKALAQICKDISDIRGVKKMFGDLLYNKVSAIENSILNSIAEQENGVEALETLAYGNLNAICDDVQPYKALNAAKTIRIMNMLSNMSTIVNNITNNVASGLTSTNALAQGSSRLAAKAFENILGKPVLAKEAKGWLFNKEIRSAEIEALKMATLVQMYGVNQEGGKLELKGDKGLFNPNVNAFEQTMAFYKFFIGMGVEATDQVKSAGLMKAMQKGIDDLYAAEKITEGQKAEMEREAKHEVERLLYKDDNRLSNFVQGVRNKLNNIKTWGNDDIGTIGLGDITMAFAKVPANVVRARLLATPEGCLLQLVQYGKGVMKAKRMNSETLARQIMESHAAEKAKLRDELYDAYELDIKEVGKEAKDEAINSAKEKLAALDRKCWEQARLQCSGGVYNKLQKKRSNYAQGLDFDDACKRCGYDEATEMSQFEAATLSRKIGKAATSAGMVVVGAILRGLGALKDFDQEPDEEKRKMLKQKGYSGLMLNLSVIGRKDHEWHDGDIIIDADFLEVIAMPLAIGATARECAMGAESKKGLAFAKSLATTGLGKAFEAAGDIPGMADAVNLYNAVTNQFNTDNAAKGARVLNAGVEFLANTLPSFLIPNAWTQFGAGLDNTVRDVYTTDNIWQQAGNILLNKTAFLRRKIPASVDMWGEERTYGENTFWGLANKMLLPGDRLVYHENKYEAELYRLSKAGYKGALPRLTVNGSFDVGDETYTLTADEKRSFRANRNEAQAEAIKAFIDSDTYNKLTDEQKVEVIKKLKMDADRTAKQAVLLDRGLDVKVTMDRWETELDLDDQIIYLGAKQLAAATWDSDLGAISDYAAMDAFIRGEYKNLSEPIKTLLNNSYSHLDDLYAASKLGITSEQWQTCYNIYQSYNATDEDGHKVYKANAANSAEMWSAMQQAAHLSDAQMRHIEENMRLHTIISPDTDQYYEYLDDAGMTREETATTIKGIEALEPTEGYSDIQPSQRYAVVVQTVPKPKQWAAFWTLVPSNASKEKTKKMRELQAQGIDLKTALAAVGWVPQIKWVDSRGKTHYKPA